MKKLIAVLMVVVCFIVNCSVDAVSIDEMLVSSDTQAEIVQAINETLQYIEPQKEYYGLGSVTFSTLQVGEQINAYEYIGTSYSPVAFDLYPLFSAGQVVALAIIRETETGEVFAQIDTQLIALLNNQDLSKEFAIIYDKTSCYYATRNQLEKIVETDNVVSSRSVLTENHYFSISREDIIFSPTKSIASLSYSGTLVPYTTRANGQIFLNVGFQNQPYGSNYCWACCVATIGNYLTSNYYTGIQVAQHKYPSNYNQGASISVALSELQALYQISYLNTYNVLTSTIKNNLLSGYPLFVDCVVIGGGGHAVVLCGYAEAAGLATVMDPDNSTGYVSAYNYTGSFTYTSLVSGNSVYFNTLGAYTA